jgi:hypothetical protein
VSRDPRPWRSQGGKASARVAIGFKAHREIAAQARPQGDRGTVQVHGPLPSTRFIKADCTAGLPESASLADLGKLSFGKNPFRRRAHRASERLFTLKGVAGDTPQDVAPDMSLCTASFFFLKLKKGSQGVWRSTHNPTCLYAEPLSSFFFLKLKKGVAGGVAKHTTHAGSSCFSLSPLIFLLLKMEAAQAQGVDDD